MIEGLLFLSELMAMLVLVVAVSRTGELAQPSDLAPFEYTEEAQPARETARKFRA